MQSPKSIQTLPDLVLSISKLLCASLLVGSGMGVAAESEPRQFRVWVFGDTHVSTDSEHGRESLAEALRQSEFGGEDGGPPFDWDIAINLGDYAGGFGVPSDEEGVEIIQQFGVLQHHRREQIYSVAGNHDATLHTESPTQWWFRKWIDPLGENPDTSGVDNDKRPYTTEGTWERYQFRVGNILFLLMSDRNDLPPPIGRGKIDAGKQVGGYPAGAVTGETFSWWRDAVEANPDDIIVSGHHHMLKETTGASGPWEGFVQLESGKWRPLYHGYTPGGAPEGASYLYYVDGKPDAQAFERYLAENESAIDVWLGAHTHLSPGRTTGGRGSLEENWGVTFINAAALSKYHNPLIVPPSSRLLTFTEGSDQMKVQYYLHTRDYHFQGWYAPEEKIVELRTRFKLDD